MLDKFNAEEYYVLVKLIKAMTKTKPAKSFSQRVGDGVIPIKCCRVFIPSEPETPKNLFRVDVSRECYVSA